MIPGYRYMKKNVVITLTILSLLLQTGCSYPLSPVSYSSFKTADTAVNSKNDTADVASSALSDLKTGSVRGGDSVHDPSIIEAPDGTYWIFGTHMEVARSDDLRYWAKVYSGVNRWNKLFSNLFEEDENGVREAFAWVGKNVEGGYSVWAPDVIYNEAMQKYVMYFCTSSSYIKSSLCYAVNDAIEGPYEFKGRLIDSGFSKSTAKKTNILDYIAYEDLNDKYLILKADYNNMLWPNAIDPTAFYDRDGKMWLVYGSWSGGIFLLELDEETGLPIHPANNDEENIDAYFGKRLIGGSHQSIEGPYILYDEVSDYYYLFVSYGSLTHDGGYQIRLFRSQDVTGPYLDPSGNTCGSENHADYGLKMIGNYTFPSLDVTYMAPGHNSAFIDSKQAADGSKKMYIVYHQRFSDREEFHEPRVHELFRTKDGWLVMAPFAADLETPAAVPVVENASDIAGAYYYVNHGLDISERVPDTVPIRLTEAQTILDSNGTVIGAYELDPENAYITISIQDSSSASVEEYNGVLRDMTDEAGNPVRCFTACGENNQTIWGVRY